MTDEIRTEEEMDALNTMDEATAPLERAEEVLNKYKGPEGGTGSANMEFIGKPPKVKKEKKDNANRALVPVAKGKRLVGKAGGTKVDVTSRKKMGTVGGIPPARGKSSGGVAPRKSVVPPAGRPKVAPKKAKTPKEMPFCLCGCKERTKGGRFRPGHDARYYSALRKKNGIKGPVHGKATGPQLVSKAS